MLKRILCFMLALMMPLTCSAQEIYAADITGDITAWNAFDDAVLDIFRGWAKDAVLHLTVGEDAADASLMLHGQKILGLHDAEAGMGIFPGNLFITGSAEERQRLLGAPPQWLVSLKRLPALVLTAAYMTKAVPLILAPYAQEEKVNFEVKNVGRAAKRITYALKKEDWALCWPLMMEETAKALQRNGADDELLQRTETLLSSLQFDKKGTLKRFINKDGIDIAWQFTGTVSQKGKDARTVTLTVGYTESGLYVKGRFPAAQGANDCRIGLSAVLEKQKLTLDGSIKRTYSGKTEQYKADAKLDVGKGLKGTVSFTLSPIGTPATQWRLSPHFEWQGDTLHGTLSASMQRDRRKAAFTLNADVRKVSDMPGFSPLTTLSAHDEPEKAGQAIRQALAPVVLSLINTVPEDKRMLIMHALGRHGRTTGDTLPPVNTLEDPNDPSYLVEEVQNP